MSTSSHKYRYRLQRQNIKDNFIDSQILRLHAAMAKKLLANPELVSLVKTNLEMRKAQGKIRYGAYITWLSILEMYDQPDVFYLHMVEKSEQMRRYRRKTPFVGILTEEERVIALQQDMFEDAKDFDL
ncbi:hypothetical protein [Thalassotalea aquiviva]|uniref:hypothetical protein n=1 Tax=Thalassotalea aquiviva TaxID=3242415 RepID=UPI003529E422